MAGLDIITTVAGLPAGPATEAGVRAIIGVQDGLDDVALALAINAVNAKVLEFPVVDTFIQTVDALGVDALWPAGYAYGAAMLATRLFARRNSPEGVASFGDQGAVYVQRNDPEVALMFSLGSSRKPAVG